MRTSHIALAVASFFAPALAQSSASSDQVTAVLPSLIPDDPLALNAFDSSSTPTTSPLQFYDGPECKVATLSQPIPGMTVPQLRARLIWNSLYTKLSSTASWATTGYGSAYWLPYMPYNSGQSVNFQSVLIQPGYFCTFPGSDWDLTPLWGTSWAFDADESAHRVAPNANGAVCQNIIQAYSSSLNVTRYQLASGLPYMCFNGTGIRDAAVLPA